MVDFVSNDSVNVGALKKSQDLYTYARTLSPASLYFFFSNVFVGDASTLRNTISATLLNANSIALWDAVSAALRDEMVCVSNGACITDVKMHESLSRIRWPKHHA
jgi:hypothetical protein